jgi:hypothetical protein
MVDKIRKYSGVITVGIVVTGIVMTWVIWISKIPAMCDTINQHSTDIQSNKEIIAEIKTEIRNININLNKTNELLEKLIMRQTK